MVCTTLYQLREKTGESHTHKRQQLDWSPVELLQMIVLIGFSINSELLI
jgi:hypothetical protein|tara:strand:+ start:491 stop:637 length:147 start_codon:yes stop_codon:yes gene_type:complete